MKNELTLREHMSRAAKARHAKMTPADRSAYGRKMVEAREAKRAEKRRLASAIEKLDPQIGGAIQRLSER